MPNKLSRLPVYLFKTYLSQYFLHECVKILQRQGDMEFNLVLLLSFATGFFGNNHRAFGRMLSATSGKRNVKR